MWGETVVNARYRRESEFHDKAFSEGTRHKASKFYSIRESSMAAYIRAVEAHCTQKRVLEYSCGPYTYSSLMMARGASITGIDLSPVAISQYVRQANRQSERPVNGCVMNAEALGFAAHSFDLVCGIGIVHHLDLRRSFSEISRALKPGGYAVFLEPLGHNPLISLYRKLTPSMRTVDEHPLLTQDIKLAEEFFENVECQFFHLSSLGAVPLQNLCCFNSVVKFLDALDQTIFRLMPYFRRCAWATVLVLSRPKHSPVP